MLIVYLVLGSATSKGTVPEIHLSTSNYRKNTLFSLPPLVLLKQNIGIAVSKVNYLWYSSCAGPLRLPNCCCNVYLEGETPNNHGKNRSFSDFVILVVKEMKISQRPIGTVHMSNLLLL